MLIGSEGWSLSVHRDALAASAAAAEMVATTLSERPDAALTFPTGSTPIGMFDVLASRAARGEVDFSHVSVFCLDEYVGATVEDPYSLTRWLWDALLHRIGIEPPQLHTLPVTADDLATAAAAYDAAIRSRGGLDLAILGLGPNGHIGYNEPGSSAESRTRVISLTPESRDQAAAYWDGAFDIPERAMTMGVATLLEAKQLVLLVTGGSKSDILRRALEEPMSADIPASWLRLAGPGLAIIADEAAASAITSGRTA